MIEIVQLLSSIVAIICSFSEITTLFYIIGSIVLFIDAIGILTGQIKKSAPIIMCVLFAVIFSLIFDYNIYANIIFVLCLECIYTYIKGIIAILKIKRIAKNAEMCDSNFDELSVATEEINTDTIQKGANNG